ncbi:MAG: alcohol dehydrogenase [Zetaproteobacteria bacterium CG_4_9_14_3_um_filter_49_83]|nr:MAG: alcohol dehydrogenase [Zetaproteobacteria bacterium CG1_02_49_23]PIQ31147.1 MAG: alcohol dehydrogenase [Zetaproteobacteria bacterium CG17_big_fil_post_rev_8_21_14_2_50_50_13]PIV29826.1 MAG: alcohol dehydrogenase [Zetaproteobacteria bacterium CG02_land_8_20_14_3_00_50_9]PIY54827.1 MAG: alcohol dehydrogenase [Zetaproteobacteria bacterium CG_4_10_14_0_8_um_filter_49_80]PJA35806.1 MAG: alcohol dehydrogenase [Zetaproteobacteria bacterium CG_4_9_14_3_um_filter_49_83]
MRAMMIESTGAVNVLKSADMARPEITDPQQVLVRVHAAGVNPIDTKLRKNGLYFPDQYPAILGCDGAGIITAVGEQVEGFASGDEVFYCYGGLGQRSAAFSVGNYAEYTLVDARYLSKKPQSVSFEEAAAAPLVCITAWESLFDRANLHGGETVLISGGCGGVGHVALQMAKIAGCKVAVTVGDDDKADFARRLGADLIINYNTDDLHQCVMQWTNNQGVDVALDTVGGSIFHALASVVAIYGDLVTLLQLPADTDWKSLRLRNIRICQELMLTPMVCGLPELGMRHAEILDQCAQWMDERKLHVHVTEVLPLQDAAKAHEIVEQGHTLGKVVLEI